VTHEFVLLVPRNMTINSLTKPNYNSHVTLGRLVNSEQSQNYDYFRFVLILSVQMVLPDYVQQCELLHPHAMTFDIFQTCDRVRIHRMKMNQL
jgi:hypothetical protein